MVDGSAPPRRGEPVRSLEARSDWAEARGGTWPTGASLPAAAFSLAGRTSGGAARPCRCRLKNGCHAKQAEAYVTVRRESPASLIGRVPASEAGGCRFESCSGDCRFDVFVGHVESPLGCNPSARACRFDPCRTHCLSHGRSRVCRFAWQRPKLSEQVRFLPGILRRRSSTG